MRLTELGLNIRTFSTLVRQGLVTVGHVVDKSDEELLAIRNFGQPSLTDLDEKLAEHGIRRG